MKGARKRLQVGDADVVIPCLDSNPGPEPDPMDVDSEYGGPAHNTHVTHSNKRPRNSSHTDTERYLPRVTIMDLPFDIFTEVFKYLRPGDLLSLARCKPFRGSLMHKSSQLIWREVMKNVRELPPCPPSFSEPQYLTVLFSNFCSVCGNAKKSQLDAILLVRLCKVCQKGCLARLINPHEVPVEVRDFVHKSNVFGNGKNGQLPEARVLKSDVHNVVKALKEAEESDSNRTVTQLKEQLRETVLERRAQSEKIIRALELSKNDLEWEEKEIIEKRRQEIQRRCIDDLGFRSEDLQFAWGSPGLDKYYKVLNKPRFLDDYEWRDIIPKLKRLINANRKERFAKERDDRHRNQSSYYGGTGCSRKPLVLEIDPLVDSLYPIEEIALPV